MKLLLATRNRHKIGEMREILKDMEEIELLTAEQFPQLSEVEEKGSTLRENAIQKACHTVQCTGHLCLAEDTGLEVDALGGKPGVRSSRFAGDGATYDQNIDKLLSLMQQIPWEDRRARFRSVVAIVEPGGSPYLLEGVCEGRITPERRGKGGFGYDPIFEVDGYGKTFAELEQDLKNRISHRALALAGAKDYLKKMVEGKPSSG
jgi:XTP/dITP diphosphohydrolase